jgi:hypothetical protein
MCRGGASAPPLFFLPTNSFFFCYGVEEGQIKNRNFSDYYLGGVKTVKK